MVESADSWQVFYINPNYKKNLCFFRYGILFQLPDNLIQIFFR